MQTPDGVVFIPDISVSPDGTMTVTVDGETFEADPQTMEIEGQIITFKDHDGRRFVHDGTALREEIREFVPANTITFEREGGTPDIIRLNEKRNLKEIYDNMLIWFVGSYRGLDENQELRDKVNKVIDENPEQYGKFKEIGNGSDYQLRVEFMHFVLEQSGGLLTIRNHKREKMEVDFNQPPVIVVEKVDKIDTLKFDHTQAISHENPQTGMGVRIGKSKTGGLEIRVQYLAERLKHKVSPFSTYEFPQLVTHVIRFHVGRTYFGTVDSTAFNPNLYMPADVDPEHFAYYIRAIKNKDKFLLVK
jgi:hypothetical protein